MHIPSQGFIIFKIMTSSKGEVIKIPFFHGLSTLMLDKGDAETSEVLTEICHKLSMVDQPAYYHFELHNSKTNIEIIGQKLNS